MGGENLAPHYRLTLSRKGVMCIDEDPWKASTRRTKRKARDLPAGLGSGVMKVHLARAPTSLF